MAKQQASLFAPSAPSKGKVKVRRHRRHRPRKPNGAKSVAVKPHDRGKPRRRKR